MMKSATYYLARIFRLGITVILSAVILNFVVIAEDMESRIDEYVQSYVKMDEFSGSILVSRDDKILICKGYGFANIEHEVPNTTKTKYRIGSMTKQFTAMAIMQLVEKKLIRIDDPIIKYIPDYPNGENITIHNLLIHTSGIPDITGLMKFHEVKTKRLTIEKTIDLFKNEALEFTPGSKYEYSNSNYILLGNIIDRVCGTSYETFLNEEIFRPLNMLDTGHDNHNKIIKNRASGYFPGGEGLVNANYIDIAFARGGGGLYSTVEDLYRWNKALKTTRLVTKSSLDIIFTPYKGNYGYGWEIDKIFGRKCVKHGGGIEGFSSYIMRFTDDNVCIIVLCNIDYSPVRRIGRDIAAILFQKKYEFPRKRELTNVDTSRYDDYVGKYEIEPGNILNVTRKENHLYAFPTGEPNLEIYPISENKFRFKIFDGKITFVSDEKGKVTKLIFNLAGKDIHAKKIE